MNDLIVSAGGAAGLPAKHDEARRALRSATPDVERLKIRDVAMATGAAAAILELTFDCKES